MKESKNTQPQKKFTVLLIGDSCRDDYVVGIVDRLSPEAPVPVIKIHEQYSVPGMAANVKSNLESLGVELDFITNDTPIIKTRYIDRRSQQHLLRVDTEPKLPAWSGRTSFPFTDYDAVVISDYNKGFLTYELIAEVIAKAKCPIFIDTKKTQLADISAAHVYVKINELEYKNSRSSPSNLIVTLGDRGAWLKTTDRDIIIPTESVEVVDVCGCGDTFLSALTYKYLLTESIEYAIIFANRAAGITVKHRGNYSPSLEEINRA